MGMTKCGVYYDLTESTFCYYMAEGVFYFSSKSHLQKFTARLPTARTEMNFMIERTWKLHAEFNFVAALALYVKIETRGFYITIGCENRKYASLEEFERDWKLTYTYNEGW